MSASKQITVLNKSARGLSFPDFTDLNRLCLLSTGGTIVSTDADPVGLALDSSPRLNNALQATTTKRPLYKTNSGKPYLLFDGVDDHLDTPFTPTAAMTIACAFRTATTSGVLIGCRTTAPLGAYLQIDISGRLGGGWGSVGSGTIVAGSNILNADHVGILVADASNVSLYLDGTSIYSAAPTGTPAGIAVGLSLGCLNTLGAFGSYSNCRIYGVDVRPYRANATQIASINAALRSTYP